jgi:arsenate reductase (glutaredoxin)
MPDHPVTLYGIPNCDSVKRARARLAAAGIPVEFHDLKKLGVPAASLDAWLAAAGWTTLLNRRGTTWRGFDVATQASVVDAASARELMLAWPSLVKRPVIEWGNGVLTVGLDAMEERLT